MAKNKDILQFIGGDMERMARVFSNAMRDYYETRVHDKMILAYKALRDGKHVYNTGKGSWDNLSSDRLFEDGDNYYGIVDPSKLKTNKKMIYIHTANLQFVLQIIEKKYIDSFNDTVYPGVRIFRVYDEIDTDIVENSWNLKTTEQWLTKLDLARDTYTDVTKHSQKVGAHVVCSRPTIRRIIADNNKKEHMGTTVAARCSQPHITSRTWA